jgi:hypothetical protein
VTAHWIGYIVIVLVLSVIRVVIEDGARDRALAYVLCGVVLLALVVFWVLGWLGWRSA